MASSSGFHTAFWLVVLTLAVLIVHGYHPFSEDAGIYVAGVRKLVDPSLYKPDAAFVLSGTRLSLFPHLLAAFVRVSRIPLEYLLLIAHLASIFAFLLACWSLAHRIFTSHAAQWSAVAFVGACFTMPLAGTSLMLMDPYVTSRSFSTPLGLFAIAAAIDRRWTFATALLILTGLIHPLMAVYVVAFVLLFVLVDFGHPRAAGSLSILGVIASGVIYLATLHNPVPDAYHQAILSRTYLFPSQWIWFEYLGLILPLVMYAFALRSLGPQTLPGKLCLVAIMLGSSSALSAFFFVRPSGPYLLARMQLLRSFHILYLLGIILLGGLIGSIPPQKPALRWVPGAILAASTVAMFLTQLFTYPLSAHIEFPGATPRNPWQQAFLWIGANTPADAVFAANPDLVLLHGEDGQSFRVMTGRSLLGDYKDTGVVVIFPQLASQWALERNAQAGIDQISDPERISRLRSLGVNWLLLSGSAVTSFPCPYRNAVSQVCRLGP
jgi:hypothetical protein